MVLISGSVWVGFFYLQDRREPEPIPYIITSFMTGIGAWALVAHPLLNIVFRTGEWIHASTLLFVMASFLIKGSLFSLLICCGLYFFFIPLKEFDEPVDGMVYGAVIGAGYAVSKVIYSLWIHPETTLFTMAYLITTQVLIHSAVGSLIGYLTGQAKFLKKNLQGVSIIGVMIGIVLIGIYHLLNEFIFVSGFPHAFWLSFASTVIYTIIILIFCVIKMRHLTEKRPPKPRRINFNLTALLIIYVIVLLMVASVISVHGRKGKRFEDPEYKLSFQYPHSLSSYSFHGVIRDASLSSSSFKTIFYKKNKNYPKFHLSVKVQEKKGKLDISSLTSYVTLSKTETFRIEDITIGKKNGKRIRWSYLEKPSPKPGDFPILNKIITDIIPIRNHLFIFTFRASGDEFEAGINRYGKILKSVRWNK